VYKGLAIATGTATGDFLYATNFHAGTVDVFNSTFAQVNGTLPPGAFTDPDLPSGYAPFGIQNLNGVIYVTYALQDALKHDDVGGKGHGFVNVFDTAGKLLRRVASQEKLNSPWGSRSLLLTSDSLAATCSSEISATARSMPSTPVISTATASIRSVASSTPPTGRRSSSTASGGSPLAAAPLPAGRGIRSSLPPALVARSTACSARLWRPRHLSIGTRIRQLEDSRTHASVRLSLSVASACALDLAACLIVVGEATFSWRRISASPPEILAALGSSVHPVSKR